MQFSFTVLAMSLLALTQAVAVPGELQCRCTPGVAACGGGLQCGDGPDIVSHSTYKHDLLQWGENMRVTFGCLSQSWTIKPEKELEY